LPYDAEKRLWKCTYCGSEFTREQILELTAQKSDADIDIKKPEYKEDTEIPEDQPELNLYRCQNCGAEMVADQNTSSTFCVYCGSTGILKSRLEKIKVICQQPTVCQNPTISMTSSIK
jgi:DNA-directed RNA polymerase subunit RPC12/RpoP